MSTDYCTLEPVPFADVFDGRLARYDVHEHVVPDETSDRKRCLTDGRHYLWCYAGNDGQLACMTRYCVTNNPLRVLEAIARVFDVDIVSEYEPQFWGFETEEEWDACMDELDQKHRKNFYEDVLRYVRGEPNSIQKGTIGELKAEIAKELISKTPALAEDKDGLLDAVDQIYEERHSVKVTLSEEDIAFAKMCVTLEDDLPQA